MFHPRPVPGSAPPETADRGFPDLLRRLRPRVLWLLGRHRIPPQDGDDLVQQTLLALIGKYGEVRDPEAWVLGTLRHKCLRYWRRSATLFERVEEEVLEQTAPAEAPGQELADLRHDLEAALARLPERCRRILRQRYALGYRATEIAEALGYPPATVRKITSRCLRALARELGVAEAGEGER